MFIQLSVFFYKLVHLFGRGIFLCKINHFILKKIISITLKNLENFKHNFDTWRTDTTFVISDSAFCDSELCGKFRLRITQSFSLIA